VWGSRPQRCRRCCPFGTFFIIVTVVVVAAAVVVVVVRQIPSCRA